MSNPRPILKPLPSPTLTGSSSPLPFASSRVPMLESPHVHFPPTPTMTSMEITHSPFMYDRKPIVVLPNVCALPERGGRRLELLEKKEREMFSNGNKERSGYFNPRVLEPVDYSDRNLSLPTSSPVSQHPHQHPSSSHPYPYPPHRQHGSPHNQTGHDRHHYLPSSSGYGKPIPPPLVFDSSESSDSSGGEPTPPPSSIMGSIANATYAAAHSTAAFQYAARPADLTIPFLSLSLSPPKESRKRAGSNSSNSDSGSPTKPSSATPTRERTRKLSTCSIERTTRKVIGSASCAQPSFCEPALEGCLGGF